MKRLVALFIAVTAVTAAVTFLATGANADVQEASATLKNAAGQDVATVSLVESVHDEVLVKVQARNLPPGAHGMHIHAIGQCAPAAFTSAGAHFNPHSKVHGLANSGGPHAGDLPNLIIDDRGNGSFEMVVSRFTVHTGLTGILDADGSALVIHAGPDDGITDATGNSGDRIACGVIAAGKAAPLASTSAVVTPPRTGDAGLLAYDRSGAAGAGALLVLAIAGGAAIAVARRRA